MALNFLGLGFSFGSKDAGLGKSVKKFTGGLNRFKDAFDRMSQGTETGTPKIEKGFQLIERAVGALDKLLTQNRLQTWIASISLSKLQDIAGGIKNIASGINLTTSLEATMTANSKATRALAANYGYAGKEAKQFASRAAGMAYGMNVSTDSTGKAVYAMKTWGKVLKAVGIDSDKTAVKVAEVFGIDVNELGNQLEMLRKDYGFTDEQLNSLVGSMQVFGQQTGDVKGALSKLPDMISMIGARSRALGKSLDSDTLADYASQTQELAAGFYAITQNGDKAQEQATAIATALIEADKNIGQMFAGTADDLGAFSTHLGIATGDIDAAFKLMRKGPSGFVKGMAKMVADMGGMSAMTGEQANFMRRQLEEAMGEDAASMVMKFFEGADASVLKAMADVKDATSTLGKMGKQAFSTGLTLQESFERMQQSFVTNFRSVARKEARAFVKDTGEQFKVFNKKIREIAAEDGPLSAIVRKFAEMHQVGALALIPQTLRPMAAIFGTMLSEATPLIGALGALGFRLNMLLSPFAIIGGALAALGVWFLALRMEGKSTSEAIEHMSTKIKEAVTKFGPMLLEGIRSAMKWASETAWPAARSFMRGVWDGIIYGAEAEGSDSASNLGVAIGKVLRQGFVYALGAVKTYLKNWWKKMTSIWSDDSLSFTDKIKETMEGSAGLIIAAFAIGKFTPVFSILGSLSGFLGGTLLKSVGMLGSMLTSVASTGLILFTEGFGAAFPLLTGVFQAIGAILGVSAGVAGFLAVVAGLAAAFYFFPEATQKALDAIGNFIQKAVSWLTEKALDIGFLIVKFMILGPLGMLATMGPKVIEAVVSAMKGIVQLAVKAILGVLDGIENWLVKKFPKAAKVIHAVFGFIKGTVEAIGFVLQRALEGAGIVLGWIGDALSWVGGLIADVFGLWWDITTAVYGALFDGVLWAVNKIGEGVAWVGEVASDVWGAFLTAVDKIGDALGWVYDHSIGALVDALGSVKGLVGDIIGGIGDALGSVGSFIGDAGSAVGGFFSDVGSGISDFFGGGGGGRSLVDSVQEMLGKMDSSLEAAKATAASLPAAAAPQFARFSSQGIAAADAVRKAYESAVPKAILADEEIKKKLEEFRKFQDRFDKAAAKRDFTSDDNKFLNQFHAASEEVRKLSGHSGQFYLELEKQQKESFTAAQVGNGKQTQFFIDSYQKRLDGLFDVFSAEKQHLDLMLQSGQITEKDFNTRMEAVSAKIFAQRDVLESTMQMSEQDMRNLIGSATTSAAQLAAVAMIETDKYIAGLKMNMQGLPGEMAAMQDKAIAALQAAYATEVQSVFALPAAEQAAAFADLQARYNQTQADMVAKSAEFANTHLTNATVATAQAQLFFDKTVADMTAQTDKMTSATTAAVGSMQHELGIGNEEALRSLEAIATIDPKKFDANLKKLKKSFIEFTKEIGKSFQDAWNVALKATADAMIAIDKDLTTAITQLRGLASAMDMKAAAEAEARQAARAADIKGMSAAERDQELLNATNWPLWYDDYRTQFARLITTVAGSGGNARGGRSASGDALAKKKGRRAENGAAR